MDRKGNEVAYLHEGYPIINKNFDVVTVTVRHTSCELLVTDDNLSCKVCLKYSNVLRPIYHNYMKKSAEYSNPKTNLRYITTPHHTKRIQSLRSMIHSARKRIKRLNKKLDQLTLKDGVECDDELLNSDMSAVMDKHRSEIEALDRNDFKRIFWEQQVEIHFKAVLVYYTVMGYFAC